MSYYEEQKARQRERYATDPEYRDMHRMASIKHYRKIVNDEAMLNVLKAYRKAYYAKNKERIKANALENYYKKKNAASNNNLESA